VLGPHSMSTLYGITQERDIYLHFIGFDRAAATTRVLEYYTSS